MWEVDPWGPGRDDLRNVAHSLWVRGVKFEDVDMHYPYVGNGDEDDDELIALLDADHQEKQNGEETCTATPEDNR